MRPYLLLCDSHLTRSFVALSAYANSLCQMLQQSYSSQHVCRWRCSTLLSYVQMLIGRPGTVAPWLVHKLLLWKVAHIETHPAGTCCSPDAIGYVALQVVWTWIESYVKARQESEMDSVGSRHQAETPLCPRFDKDFYCHNESPDRPDRDQLRLCLLYERLARRYSLY